VRVRSLETLATTVGRRIFVYVKLTTDEGIVGWGEAATWSGRPDRAGAST
jgi:L-alanine-DL-glutamate epimerase-like enolase superfamily enzyme